MADLNDWNVSAPNNSDAPPDGWPENSMQYSEVNNTAREGMAVVARANKDFNGSLTATGPANTYAVTLNASYSAYFTGMMLAAKFPTANTGPSTLNVNGIGAQAITDRSGAALTAGEISDGGIYEFRYDGANFQMMGTLTGTANITQATLSNPNEPDLVDTDVALRVGALDPDTAPHLEAGPSTIQSKADATNAAKLNLNSNGGDVSIGSQTAAASLVTVFSEGAERAAFFDPGPYFSGQDNGNGTTTPVTSLITLASLNQNDYGDIGFNNSIDMQVRNLTDAGQVGLIAEGRTALQTDSDGIDVAGSVVASTPADQSDLLDTVVDLFDQPGAQRLAHIGFLGTSQLEFANRVRSANTAIVGRNSVAAFRTGLLLDPDGPLTLYHPENDNLVLTTSRNGVAVSADAGFPLIIDAKAPVGEDGRIQLHADSGGAALSVDQATGDAAIERADGTGARLDDWITMLDGGGVALFHNGIKRLESQAGGQVDLYADDETSIVNRRYNIRSQAGTLQGRFGFNGSDELVLENRINSEKLVLYARATAGTARALVTLDPTGSDANETPSVQFAVGANVRANVRGYEDDDFGTSFSHFNGQGVEKPTGFNVMPTIEQSTSNTITSLDRVGCIFFNTAAFAPTYTVAQDTTTPLGATWAIANESSGDITLQAGTGVAIKWFDSSTETVETRASGGSFLLATAATATLYKRNDTEYWLWGAGIS